MKTFNLLTICIGCIFAFVFTGCFGDQPQTPEPLVRTETKEVYIPVYCNGPKVTCEFSGGGTITLGKLMKCISDQKAALAYCSKDNMIKHEPTLIDLTKQENK
jgi:hypothetical protein